MLRIVFIGDYELGAAVLRGVLGSSHTLLGVVHAMPDGAAMWWRRRLWNFFSPDETARLVRESRLPVLSGRGANSDGFRSRVRALGPDVILMSSWGEILEAPTIALPKLACVNCHPSLLPKHRGVDPFASVIVEGERKTGITFHAVTGELDAGDVLLQRELDVAADDTPASLRAKCAFLAERTVGELLDRLERGELERRPQDEAQASRFLRYASPDGEIDWTRPAREIHDRIRGLTPEVGCCAGFNGRRLRIGSSRIVGLDAPATIPGTVLGACGNQLLVATGDPDRGILVEIRDSVKTVGFFNKARAHRFIVGNVRAGSLLDVRARGGGRGGAG